MSGAKAAGPENAGEASSVRPTGLLVVVRGEPAGSRHPIDARERIVGRGVDADVRLLDPRISRHHARVAWGSRGLEVVCLPDTAPVLVDGMELREGIVAVGQQLVIGDTVLAVAALPTEVPTSEATDMRTLLSGIAADVRGLGAVIAITEALDGVTTRAEVAPALRAWGKRYARALDARLVEDRSAPDDAVVRRASDGGWLVVVPTHANVHATIELDLAGDAPDVGAGLLRLLVVAGRLCGSTLMRVDSFAAVDSERASLRDLAVGSARGFLGSSPAAERVAKLVARIGASDVVALLEGETGVGKTFVARLIHEAGARARSPLVVVNCAAIPESLVESELFGHERGAFTGAVGARAGVFETAGAGTVLLDEVGELPLASQAKLLHVLEDRSFARIGSTRAIPLRARVLAATNRDLDAMVGEGTFRRDLFFRLGVVRIAIPPLRDRGDDLVLLARHLLADLAASSPRRVDGFSPAALDVIRCYPWPGNARELRNVIEHALVLGDGARVEVEDLPSAVRVAAAAAARGEGAGATALAPEPGEARRAVDLPANLDWLEKQAIAAALDATGGNQRRAAAILGINRATLHRKLRADKE